MERGRRRWLSLAAATALAVWGLGCMGLGQPGEPIRYWVLSALPDPDPGAVANARPTLHVGPLDLPPHLDRPGIVTRSGDHRLVVTSLDHWGEPLSKGIKRVLAENIMALLPGVTAVTGLILLVNGFNFLLLMMGHAKAGVDMGLFKGFDPELLARFGAGLSFPYRFPDGVVTGGEWWRLVTPIFMHGSMMHFFFNSFLLVQLGPLTQQLYGSRLWPIYLLCGLCGSAASQLTRPTMTVGASGAIMGLIGLLLVHGLRNRSQLGQAMKSMLIRLILYTVVLSFVFNIDHRAHAGGFFCGALLAFVVPENEPTGTSALLWKVLSVLGVLLVLISFGMVGGLGKYF